MQPCKKGAEYRELVTAVHQAACCCGAYTAHMAAEQLSGRELGSKVSLIDMPVILQDLL